MNRKRKLATLALLSIGFALAQIKTPNEGAAIQEVVATSDPSLTVSCVGYNQELHNVVDGKFFYCSAATGLWTQSNLGTGGGAVPTLRRITATEASSDTISGSTVLCDATTNTAVTETLPATPSVNGFTFYYKRVDRVAGHSCALTAQAGATIEGAAGAVNVASLNALTVKWESATSTWWEF